MPASREQAIKNLKGKTGSKANPNGRPKADWTWAGLVKEALEELEADGTPVKKSISRALAKKALEGDVQAIKEIGNRIDGMPKQALDLNNSGSLEVTWKDANRS